MQLTNATKAIVISSVNVFLGSVMALLVAFNVPLSGEQQAAISGTIVGGLNLAALVYTLVTYKDSPRRLPEDLSVEDGVVVMKNPPHMIFVDDDQDLREPMV